MTRGTTLRVELDEPSLIKTVCAGTEVELATQRTGLGTHVADFPHTATLSVDAAIELSFQLEKAKASTFRGSRYR